MIKNLVFGLSEAGKIKAGIKGEKITSKNGVEFRPPQKLPYYIIVKNERDDNGDFIHDEELMNTLKESGKAVLDKDGNIVGIPIRLLYNDIDLNFQTRYASYVGSRCVCSGDGERAHTRDGRDVKCPCERLEVTYTGKEKCKPNGKLYCIIEGQQTVGSAYVLRTTSINTVKSILGSLSFIQACTGGMLAFLPLYLMLQPKAATTPEGKTTTVYISSIVYRGSVDELQRVTIERAQSNANFLIEMKSVEETARKMITARVETPEEAAEVQEEFYPEGVEVETKKEEPKKKTQKKKTTEKKSQKKKKEDPYGPTEQKRPNATEEVAKDVHDSRTETDAPPDQVDTEENTTTTPPGNVGTADSGEPITQNQKLEIVRLKRDQNITDPKVWTDILKPFGVKTAKDMTAEQAAEFIRFLKEEFVPF